MPTVYSVQNGQWTDGTTWNTGSAPTVDDDVNIYHTVTLYNNNPASATLVWGKLVSLRDGGSLVVDKRATGPITAVFEQLRLYAVLNDTRRVDLDGVRFDRTRPSISASTPTYPDAYSTPIIIDQGDGEVIIDDTGFVSVSSVLRDIRPEGTGRAYAEKIGNAVRYHTLRVKIKYTALHNLRILYRMAANPFQVLAVTPSCAIKGWIESVTPDPASVGAEYITVRVTITEGT